MTGRLIRLLTLSFMVAGAVVVSAQVPSPALLVLDKDDNTLVIVDPATNKVVGSAPTGDAPHEVAASSDGRFAYVTNYGPFQPDQPGDSLSVIDLNTRKETRVDISPLRRPHGIEFADGKVYFTAELNKAIARLDPQSLKVDWLLGTGQNRTHMIVLAKDMKTIFTTNTQSNTVSMIERTSGADQWTETVIPVGNGSEGCDLSPNGKEFWVANGGDPTVSVIDVATRKVVQTLDVGTKHSNRLKFTPDGKLVLVSDLGSGDLVVIDASSRKVIKRVNLGGKSAEGVLIVPDGSRAYVALSADGKVAIVDLKTLSKTGEIATGRGPDGMAWTGR
jgi:YVTN family beta-propeller protein